MKVWNHTNIDFPQEGNNRLLPAEDCLVNMQLKLEAAQQARKVQFDLPNINDLAQYKKNLRTKLWEKFGTVYDEKLPLNIKNYGKIQCDGFRIEKVIYQSKQGVYVTALLYIPDGEGPFPAVINMHGHNMEGKLAPRIQTISQTIVKRGYVCISPDAFGVYERAVNYLEKEYHGGILGGALLNVGETLMGNQVVDNMKAVDVLQSLPFVIKNKIGATGGSGGGNQTMWLTAMDDRIVAAMPVVSVGSFESYVTGINCICELLIDGLTFTEEAGILALIAPRPLRIGNSLFDVNPTFAVSEMLKTYRQIEKLYRQLGAEDNIANTVAPKVHGMHKEHREAMLGWFDLHLKGKGHGGAVEEATTNPLSDDELKMFTSNADRPKEVISIAQYCYQKGQKLISENNNIAYDLEKKRQELVNILRLQDIPEKLDVIKYSTTNNFSRLCIEVNNRLIPILINQNNSKKFIVFANPQGKENISNSKIEDALKNGYAVVLFDFFTTGETANPNSLLGEHHQYVRQLLWLGKSLIGEWVLDLLCIEKLLAENYNAQSILIEGEKEAGVAAIFASALNSNLQVKAINSPISLLFKYDEFKTFVMDSTPKLDAYYSIILSIPNFLQWGDIPLAVELSDNKVEFITPRNIDGSLAQI